MLIESPVLVSGKARPEDKLLLACARARIDDATIAQIRIMLQETIDWDYLTLMAHHHRLLPLLYWNLNVSAPQAVPASMFAQLRTRFQDGAGYSLLLISELIKLLTRLESVGIKAIPFKGPTLGATIYGNLMLRPFSDLDILVHIHDVQRARDILVDEGYAFSIDEPGMDEQAYLQQYHQFSFRRHDGKVAVELQWGVTPHYLAYRLDFDSIWQHRDDVRLLGKRVSVLPTEDLLIVLCVHGGKHLWERLIWLCDVAELLNTHPDINWERILQRARCQGIERMLLLGVLLAHVVLGTAAPLAVLQAARANANVRQLVELVCARLFLAQGQRSLVGFNMPFFYPLMTDRFLDRLRVYRKFYRHYLGYYLRWPLSRARKFA